MRLGYLSKGSVSLDEVKGVEKVESIPGVVFRKYSPNNYCNRFRKGIRIITEKRVIWVSPEDIERFISELGFTGR
nr:hypothetical protein [Candidatus Freyarchaeota archaeon]